MKCCQCREHDLVSEMTKQGIMIDRCPVCNGVWLDKGEIFYFTKVPTSLNRDINKALENQSPSCRVDPKTGQPMVELSIMNGKLKIDYSPSTGGIWLDQGELERLPFSRLAEVKLEIKDLFKGKTSWKSKNLLLNIEFDKPEESKRKKLLLAAAMDLPPLGLVSGATLFVLYAMLTFVLLSLVHFKIIEDWLAILIGFTVVFAQYLLSPLLLDFIMGNFYKASNTPYSSLPEHLREFIVKMTAKYSIDRPVIMLIKDGSPNAFTYGHTPHNARIVLTTGLMDLLSPQELEAVVAHEIGHAVHWDMVVMTIAYLVPLLLNLVVRRTASSGGRSKGALVAVAFVMYVVSECAVLYLSRVREYFADRFSGDNTDPRALASALVKIGYGLAGRDKAAMESQGKMETVKAMGIFDPLTARALTVSSYRPNDMGGEVDKALLKKAMRWDMWNPWSSYYELQSTHPLIANRLDALSALCSAKGKEPYIEFNEYQPESYWDEFFADAFFVVLPQASFLFFFFMFFRDVWFYKPGWFYPALGMIVTGFTYLIFFLRSYDFSFFPEMKISSLLKKVKVSAVRPVPCTVKGTVIGKGVPGLIWSEDFVLQDETGIIFLDYKQDMGLGELFFGLFIAPRFKGKEITVRGWYRRAPAPYVEISSFQCGAEIRQCYAFHIQVGFALLMAVAGLLLLVWK